MASRLAPTIDGRLAGPYGPPHMSQPAPPVLSCSPVMACERPQDAALVDALIERAFGPGRLAKTAERVREANRPLADLSFVAWMGEAAAGCVRLWPVHIDETPALLLGPFAVDDPWRSRGLGSALIAHACQAATEAGHGVVLLVGDEPYFRKLGFTAVPFGQVVLPGPANPRRILWRALRPGATEGVGGLVRAG
jgi:predicted N-acetyltransferase YhbS